MTCLIHSLRAKQRILLYGMYPLTFICVLRESYTGHLDLTCCSVSSNTNSTRTEVCRILDSTKMSCWLYRSVPFFPSSQMFQLFYLKFKFAELNMTAGRGVFICTFTCFKQYHFLVWSAFKAFTACTHLDPDEYKLKQDFPSAVSWSYKASFFIYFPINGSQDKDSQLSIIWAVIMSSSSDI